MLASDRARERRAGGRWSTPRLLPDLLRLAAIERAAVYLVAGWVPKVADLDQKIALASGLEEGMLRAGAARRHALALLERDETRLRASPEWVAPLRELDETGDGQAVVRAVQGAVRPFLLDRYRSLAAALDPLLDARTRSTVASAVSALGSACASIGTDASRPPRDRAMYRALVEAWGAGGAGQVALDDVLWAPRDRVCVPARPAHRPRPVAGSRTHYRKGSRRERDDLAGELNDNVMSELCALELLCRCSYEHPRQPWPRHLAMLRQATDEARHAAIFRRELAREGFSEERLPQHATNYEFAYQFPECRVGSTRELLWRLLVLCTVLEALAIDKLPVEIGRRDWVGQARFARILDYIACDELFHAENGLRLTRQLCEELGLDPLLERERAHGRFFGGQRDIRLKYLAEDPERASREIAILEAEDPDGVPYQARTEVDRRLRASFTLDDCEQVERWGYSQMRDTRLKGRPRYGHDSHLHRKD